MIKDQSMGEGTSKGGGKIGEGGGRGCASEVEEKRRRRRRTLGVLMVGFQL